MAEEIGKVRDLKDSREALEKALEGLVDEIVEVPGDVYAVVKPTDYFRACSRVCGDGGPSFDYIRCYTAVHREDAIEILLHLFSSRTFLKGAIKTVIPDNKPKIDSIREIIPGADWYEREIQEMFGVNFSGLSSGARLLLADDIQGHPLRKDFVDDRPEWMFETREELMIAPAKGGEEPEDE